MAPNYLAYLKNPWADRYWKIGGEEIIGPLGPYAAGIAHAAAQADPTPEPWRVAVGQFVQAAQAKGGLVAGRDTTNTPPTISPIPDQQAVTGLSTTPVIAAMVA